MREYGKKGTLNLKFFNLPKLFLHLKVLFTAKSMARYFTIYVFVFIFFFLVVRYFRTFHFASGYGWFDPWVQIGYGQAFPDTAYGYHYYKESRILSISLEAFFLQFSPFVINFFWEILAALTALVIYRISRLVSNNVFTSLVLGALTALSPLLWGDWAGGGDYYNTFGNFISAFAALQTFATSRMVLSNTHTLSTTKRRYIISGILFLIVALETPSGIILLAPLQLILILSVFYSSRTLRKGSFITLGVLFKYQFVGVIFLLLFESLYLILLGESPTRLYAGPKFLFDNLTDPSIANVWAQSLTILDFTSRPNLLFFASLFFIQLALILSRLLSRARKDLITPELVLSVIPVVLYIALLTLQFSNRTIVFTTSYFLTPVLILGICFVSNSRIDFSGRFLLLFTLPLFFLLKQIEATYVLLALILILLILLSWGRFEQISKLGMRWRMKLSEFLLPSMLMVVLITNVSLEKPSDFDICGSARIDARAKVIEIAETLDSQGFKRGTLLMGADLAVLREPLNSECVDFNGKPLGGILIAVAQTGFPAASTLGQINTISDVNRSDFIESNLAFILAREVKPTTCYLNWESPSEKSQIRFNFMKVDFGARINCPENL